MSQRAQLILLLALFVPASGIVSRDQTAPDNFEFFEKKIRPVLVERCYKCHSVDSEKLKGGLFLDSRAEMLKGGESGKPAIVPGRAESSRLVEAIRYQNEDLQMPPKQKLSPEQIENFVAWINSGAPDPRVTQTQGAKPAIKNSKHWAFQPVGNPPIPAIRDQRRAQTPIDHFILAKLEAHQFAPAPRADKRTLLRRATFDLLGLPPTLEEVEAFLKDKSPDAFAKVIDRLLASPRYGERWGRYWLDVARYADTKGYVYTDREEGRFVHSHVYRDWVIRAFNEDMPYDQFLKLQIAADQLDPSSRGIAGSPNLAALGFLTLGQRFLGVMHDIIDDRIDVVMRGTQGLTVGCARCHDHKFDPIPTRDYYSLYGVFAGSSEKLVPVAMAQSRTEIDPAFARGLEERQTKLEKTFEAKKEQLSKRVRAKTADYLVAVLDVAKLPSEEFYSFLTPDEINPVIVRRWHAYLSSTTNKFNPIFAPWNSFAELATNDFAARADGVFQELNHNASHPLHPLIVNMFATNPPASMRVVARRYGELFEQINQKWLVQQTNSALPKLTADEESIRQVLFGSDSPASVPPGAIVDQEWFFDEGGRVELAKLQLEIDRWINKSSSSPPFAVILEDRPVQKNPRVFKRGNPVNKGDEVPRQFLEILSGPDRRPFAQGSGRRELAEAIASKENPLTARVMVNRIWLHHFGAGLVTTPSDFGTRSAGPSHPELLDWMARWFMDNGWSIKKLHRLILSSSVYQQTSEDGSVSSPAATIDPENKLLWHFHRERLDFEALRDSMLAVSGELDDATGGKAGELFKAPFSKRRSVYGFIDRQFLPGIFRVFDFANPDMHSPQRSETTVPQQALFFMNNPFPVERARALALRPEIQSAKNSKERIRGLYRLVYQRDPTTRQINAGLRFLQLAGPEILTEPPPTPPSAWQYGYGEFDEGAKQIQHFEPLPHFTGTSWQGGPDHPDEKLGWAQLTADGGHAGNDLKHAVIRRWIAPFDAVVGISGSIRHAQKEGDGIRARLVSIRGGVLGDWTLHDAKAEVRIDSLEVKQGDAIDFVVSINKSLNNNDFTWAPAIRVLKASPAQPPLAEWNAKREFGGPAAAPAKPLDAWGQYAQALLLANEFMFVD